MHQSIGKILPADHFTITKHRSYTEDHYQSLYQLYQPIIGVDATAFYLTLYHLFQPSQKHSHHHLMQILNLPLNTIYQARLSCEAIGLIYTYKRDLESGSVYHYQLNEPLTAKQFLKNDLLNQMLLHQIGNQKYQLIQESVSLVFEAQDQNQLGENVTARFSDVFQYNGAAQSFVPVANQSDESKAVPAIQEGDIDWKWLEQSLIDRMLPAKKILSRDNVMLIEQMAGLYQLTTTQLDKAIQWAVTSDHQLSREEFKAACLDLVETLPEQQVKIVNRREKIKPTVQTNKSKREQFVERMETISPKELLEDLSSGRQASQQDLRMIANIMDAQGLQPGVMNVLIHYVMLKTDMKLTRSYLEKIASHWSRKNVKTVHQAMTLAKSENNKYQQWDQKKQSNYNRPRKSQEIVPDWFKNRKKQEPKQKQTSEPNPEIDQILQAFKNKRTE